MELLENVFPIMRCMPSYRLVTIARMEGVMVVIGHLQKFYNQDFIGLLYSKTLINLLKVVMHANEWVT